MTKHFRVKLEQGKMRKSYRACDASVSTDYMTAHEYGVFCREHSVIPHKVTCTSCKKTDAFAEFVQGRIARTVASNKYEKNHKQEMLRKLLELR